MRDVHAVLFQKEHDLERVRKEVAALRTVIPLLDDEECQEARPAPVESPAAETHDQNLHDLKMYYPFARHRYEHG